MTSGWVDISKRPKGMTKKQHESLIDTQELLKSVDKRKEDYQKDEIQWAVLLEISANYSVFLHSFDWEREPQ